MARQPGITLINDISRLVTRARAMSAPKVLDWGPESNSATLIATALEWQGDVAATFGRLKNLNERAAAANTRLKTARQSLTGLYTRANDRYQPRERIKGWLKSTSSLASRKSADVIEGLKEKRPAIFGRAATLAENTAALAKKARLGEWTRNLSATLYDRTIRQTVDEYREVSAPQWRKTRERLQNWASRQSSPQLSGSFGPVSGLNASSFIIKPFGLKEIKFTVLSNGFSFPDMGPRDILTPAVAYAVAVVLRGNPSFKTASLKSIPGQSVQHQAMMLKALSHMNIPVDSGVAGDIRSRLNDEPSEGGLLAGATPTRQQVEQNWSEFIGRDDVKKIESKNAAKITAKLPDPSPLAAGLEKFREYAPPQDVPSFLFYNAPYEFDGNRERFLQEIPSRDARVGAYVAHDFGQDAENEIIVAQQVLKALNAITHFSETPEMLAAHLKNNLAMTKERAEQLATLAPILRAAIDKLPMKTVTIGKWDPIQKIAVPTEIAIKDFTADPDVVDAIATFTESAQNWGSQKEHFVGTAVITKGLMDNPAFHDWAMQEIARPMAKPLEFGIIQKALGYKRSDPLDELYKAHQALVRIARLPGDAIALVNMANLHDETVCPNPFPIDVNKQTGEKTTRPFVQPYAIDVQTAAMMIRAMADVAGRMPADVSDKLETIRLRWTYVSAHEIAAQFKLKREEALADPKMADGVPTIDAFMTDTQDMGLTAETLIREKNGKLFDDLPVMDEVTPYNPLLCHQLRAQLLNETYDLFKAVAAHAHHNRPDILGQILRRMESTLVVTDRQRKTYAEKLTGQKPAPLPQPR